MIKPLCNGATFLKWCQHMVNTFCMSYFCKLIFLCFELFVMWARLHWFLLVKNIRWTLTQPHYFPFSNYGQAKKKLYHGSQDQFLFVLHAWSNYVFEATNLELSDCKYNHQQHQYNSSAFTAVKHVKYAAKLKSNHFRKDHCYLTVTMVPVPYNPAHYN